MNYFHLYADAAGVSHWRDVAVALEERTFAPPAAHVHISDTDIAAGMLFLRLHAGWNEPAHPTPKAQTLIARAGRIRVTASDGEAREFGPGDVWRMEDTHGGGHHTQVIGDEDFDCVIVQHG